MALNIVYLDDELALCEIFKDSFESSSIIIKTFSDPLLAIADIKAHPPDLIFLDYRLPGTNGDVIALDLDANIPKVLITGDLSVNPSAKFLRIFKKPYRFQEMEEFINQFCTHS